MQKRNVLVDATFEQDYQRMIVLKSCSFHKPIKLRPVHTDEHFKEMQKTNFCGLPYAYRSRQKRFRFDGMDSIARTRFIEEFRFCSLDYIARARFIELLASLTLYHFSRSSKASYIECLDIRGLEFSDLRLGYRVGVKLSAFEGKLKGSPDLSRFDKYSICCGRLTANLGAENCMGYAADIAVKGLKMIKLSCLRESFDSFSSDFCALFMQPGVEHVKLKLTAWNSTLVEKICSQKFEQFLDYCKDVKTLTITDRMCVSFDVRVFGAFQRTIKNWSTKTSRMELFILQYGPYYFQIHKNELKNCVKVGGKWFWTDKYPFYGSYRNCSYPDEYRVFLPEYVRTSHHDNFLGIPDNTLFRNCVQESVEIRDKEAGLVLGKKCRIISSMETTFNVKMLLFQPIRQYGDPPGKIIHKQLNISGNPDNVALAKEHVMAILNRPENVAKIKRRIRG